MEAVQEPEERRAEVHHVEHAPARWIEVDGEELTCASFAACHHGDRTALFCREPHHHWGEVRWQRSARVVEIARGRRCAAAGYRKARWVDQRVEFVMPD